MKINKIIGITLAAMLAVSSLAGCSGKDDEISKNVKTITVWSGNTHSKDVVTKLVSNWNETTGKERGIYVDYQVKDSASYTQTIELALQSGEAPDFFNTDIVKGAENDYILPLEELPGGDEIIEKYKKYDRETSNMYKGKHYSVPIGSVTQGIIYNKDMFKKAGIVDENGEAKPPKTWKEIREYAKKLTDADKKQYGIVFPLKWSGWYGSDVSSSLQSSVGHLGYNPVTDEYDFSKLADIAEVIMGIKKDKSYFPGAEGLDNDPARAHFANGNIGMKFAFSFDYGVLTDQFPATCDWGVAPLPVLNEDEEYKQRADYGFSMVINKQSLERVGGDVLKEVLMLFTGDDYVKAMYKAGMTLPYDFDIVKDVKLDDGMKQWKEFAELVELSSIYPLEPSKDTANLMIPAEVFVNEVWSGKMSPKNFVKQLEENYEAATEEYYKLNSDEDRSTYINKEWNIKR